MIYKLKHRETKHKIRYSFVFWSASQSWVVPNFSDSEDGNESEIDVQPNLPKKHCSNSTSKPPSNLDLESGDKMKIGTNHFPG